MFTAPLLNRICRECYSSPDEVYARCRELGMSIVTLTDHDSIDGAESLRRHPDFFLSEEVTCRMPSGTEVHIGAYNIRERDHVEIQRRRSDFVSLLMYLTEQKIFFSVNHVFSGLTGRRDPDDFHWFASYSPAFETRNGQMWPKANHQAAKLAKKLGKIAIGGSDSHTMAGVGMTYTEVRDAKTVAEFFAGLRAQQGRVRGAEGSFTKLTADVYRITKAMFEERPELLPLASIALLVPLFTASHWAKEMWFCQKWVAHFEDADKAPRMLWELGAEVERA
jgi:predicted metal-dependent phosphoesterase TrpH